MKKRTAFDILEWVAREVGRRPYADEGISFGPAHRSVDGISVCWMPDAGAIEAAAKAGHQLLIHHEALTFPYPAFTETRERQYLAWPTNILRLKALVQTGITTARVHNSADDLCIIADWVRALGLKRYLPGSPTSSSRIYTIAPTPYAKLVARVKASMGLPHVRATCTGGPHRIIRRVGTAAGGTGLFVNVSCLAEIVEQGVDAIIAGESDNYGMRFCTESGVDLIETSHEISEAPGLRSLARKLARAFPKIEVKYIEQEAVWRMM